MERLPPEVERFFQQQRNEQRAHNNTALVQKNLRDTTAALHGIMEHTAERGVSITLVQHDADALVESSNEFLQQTTEKNYCWCCKAFILLIPPWWYNKKNEEGQIRGGGRARGRKLL